MSQNEEGKPKGIPTRLAGFGPAAAFDKVKKVMVFHVYEGKAGEGAAKKVIRVHKERIVLGSVVSADVRLSGESVAPIHAVIEVHQDSEGKEEKLATIYDLASESGVWINNDRKIHASLKKTDKLRIGDHDITFEVVSAEDAFKSIRSSISGEGQKLFVSPDEDMPALLLEDNRKVVPIFDYRPTSKPALEVVMSWYGTILDIQHFTENDGNVTIGDKRENDFGIPALLNDSNFVLASAGAGGFQVNIDPKMTGVVQSQGELRSLHDVQIGMKGQPSFQLGKNDFAKLTIGSIDFYLSYTSAPPTLKRQKIFASDPFLFQTVGISVLLSAAALITVLNTKVEPSIKVEELPPRVATILYQPEKYTSHVELRPKIKTEAEKAAEPPKPKPQPPKKVKVDLDKVQPKPAVTPPKTIKLAEEKPKPAPSKPQKAQSEGQEGAGARAAGKEGTRGTKTAASDREHQNAAKRPSPEAGTGRGGSRSQVADQGNLDLLKGAAGKIEDLLGSSAQRLGKSGSALKGFGGFDTKGSGGLALSGQGAGGGGTSANSLGGLSDKGRGGGRVGTGLGAAGSGGNIIGGKVSRVEIRMGGPEETVVMGSIDADAIDAALRAHKDEFMYCYSREINAGQPDLQGKVKFSFVIGGSGRVTQAGVAGSSLDSANAQACMIGVLKRIQFPQPEGGGVVEVNKTMSFSPGR